MNIKAGIISGFAATVVLSVIMVMKTAMGVMPELNAIKMLAGMMDAPMVMGWKIINPRSSCQWCIWSMAG